MRTALRILAFLLALPLLGVGLGGLALHQRAPELLEKVETELIPEIVRQAREAGHSEQEIAEGVTQIRQVLKQVQEIPLLPISGGALAVALGLILFGFWPAGGPRPARKKVRRKGAAADAEAPEPGATDYADPLEDPGAFLSKKERKRHYKAAGALEAAHGAERAAEYLLDQGLKDEGAETFMRGELFDRAAEVRYDQNRFDDAADLYRQAGRHEAAGSIYAQIEQYEKAARCYLEDDKCSIAGEMFERAENFREAGQCYEQIGFFQQAAKAFLRAGAKACAADALIAAFNDEGGGGGAQTDQKARELKGVAKKAGELLVELERLDEAENVLVRAGLYGRAAQVAYQLGAYDRASEFFLRVGRGDLAAKALKKLGNLEAAERALGEYLRDKGDDGEAVTHLAEAGEHGAAGDLFRKLERYAEAGESYMLADDFPAAAEMFRVSEQPGRAGEAFERCQQYDQAAECFAEAGDQGRQAAALERARRHYEAGVAYAEHGEADEAIRVLQQVEDDDVHYSEACTLLGRLFQEKGMQTLSIKKFEQAAGDRNICKANVEAFYDLSQALESRGEFERSVEIYEKILAFDYHYGDVSERVDEVKQKLEEARAAAAEAEASQGEVTQPSQAFSAPPPAQPGRYEVIRELGRGGMGVVYLARDSVLEREIAYKVLPESLRQNSNALRNFLREAKAAAQLNHPNIVTVYDAGESDQGLYLAMELVDGTTLKELLSSRGAVAPGGVIYILRQMGEALAFAHSKRVVHRDIKTANTMWTVDKQVKIMDFGLAKLMEEVRQATTLVSGTPYYMSPEQTLGRNVDHRTDIYSLGVTLFELATAQLPFQQGNVPYHHVHTPPPDPLSVKPDLPPALGRIILKCLEKDPDERYQSARELIDEVDRLTGRGTTES